MKHPARIPRFASALALLLGGCALGPDPGQAPPINTPDTWTGAIPKVAATDTIRGERWWRAFGDPTLTRLVERARGKNATLGAAAASVARARAMTRAARAPLLPELDASGEAADRELSARTFENFPLPPGAEPELEQTVYEAAFDASWEIDLFGRNRRRLQAAEARLGGAEAALHAARLSVSSETARVYLEHRGAVARAGALRRAVRHTEALLRTIRARREAGLATPAQVARARADVEAARAKLEPVAAEQTVLAYRLGALTHRNPPAIRRLLASEGARSAKDGPGGIPLPEWTTPAEQPLAVIRDRPDIREAEHALAEATAEVGAATADRYPRIRLGAALFAEAPAPSGIGEAAYRGRSLTTGILAPLWRGGRLRANLDAAEAQHDNAEARFRQAVFDALADVESALRRYRSARETYTNRRNARQAQARSVRETETLQQQGLADAAALARSKATLARAEAALARARTDYATAAVALNKALGGAPLTDSATTSTPPPGPSS